MGSKILTINVMTALTDHLLDGEQADQLFIEEQSANSDDTVFLDLPLPPVPHRAVHVHNVDEDHGNTVIVSRLYSRMDDFEMAPRLSPESCTLSVGDDGSSNVSDWSSSDEDTSFYQDRERLSQFRCSESLKSNDCKKRSYSRELEIRSQKLGKGTKNLHFVCILF